MNFNIHLISYILFISCISCNQSNSDLPENNSISYLDSITLTNTVNKDNIQANKLNYSDINCFKSHINLKGNIFFKDFDFEQKQERKYIIQLSQSITLNCDNNQQIQSDQVLLNSENVINFEQYLGYTVVVIGELQKSKRFSNQIPLEIQIIRIEPM